MNGFTGSSCDRLSCNLNCNEGGLCYTMRDLASKTKNTQSLQYAYSTPWDAGKMKGRLLLTVLADIIEFLFARMCL